ncbi:MAG TPA: hypothetical protein VK469_06625 [Candidatus Kapabacteria bacterium]|nr:hypothetical protein [Candidatus Kapabacteria bacterium]
MKGKTPKQDIEKKSDKNELIDFSEPATIGIKDLQYETGKTREDLEIITDNDNTGESIGITNLKYHTPDKIREIGFYLLVGAFVMAVFGCEAYSIATNNKELLKESIFMLGNAAMLGIGYYFGNKE